MSGDDAPVAVRCPAGGCGAVFRIEPRHLGRNVYCLLCGVRMTARPAAVDAALRERQRARPAGRGAGVARLPWMALVDDVRSLWNVGSMFRTADACGARELALCGITGHPPRAEIAKTALGAEEAVAWRYHADALEALDAAERAGYVPVALETGGGAVPVHDLDWPSPCCLIVGNEVAGVSAALLRRAALRAAIPMYGVKDSLNVAVAFGIAAQALARRLV